MARRNLRGMRYVEGPPQATTTGVGKDYNGYRIFHAARTGLIERIENDGETRRPSEAEAERFRKDLSAAASRDKEVRAYLSRFPGLRHCGMQELAGMKPEPEGMAGKPEGDGQVSPLAGGEGGTRPEAATGEGRQTAR